MAHHRAGRVIRKIGLDDLDLLLRAQAACSHEMDAMPVEHIQTALVAGCIQGIVLEAPGRTSVVCWQKDGKNAILTAFYREGSPEGFLGDVRDGFDRLTGILKEWGVDQVFVALGINNPQFDRLYRLYKRLGLVADVVRMGKEI